LSRFLVTGGCGFIGSHLCNALLDRHHDVCVIDDLSSGLRTNLAERAQLSIGDVADPAAVADAVAGIDGCFHLAAIASVEQGLHDWLGTHRTNLTGTITIFDALRRLPQSRRVPVVYASSAAVYGDCETLPIVETAEKRPRSAYGADKLGCELHARVATEVHGIPTVGLRFFNVYGPRQNPRSPYSGVISIFCDRLSRGEHIDIFGMGDQTRDFVFVDDVVAALLSAMHGRPDGAPVYNVATGVATSVMDLAAVAARLAGVPLDVRYKPPREGEIRHSLGSTARSQDALGLGEPTPLETGLGKVLEWMNESR
jgi:UDP-glucose 4-epimerase